MSHIPKLVVLSRNIANRDILISQLQGLDADFRGISIEFKDLALASAVAPETDIIVIDLERGMPPDETVLADLRRRGVKCPVVILSDQVSAETSKQYQTHKAVFFDRGNGVERMLELIKQVIHGALVAARAHPRHMTSEKASFVIEGKSGNFECRVRNLSKGGALLEMEAPISKLFVGSVVHLHVRLKSVKRSHALKARVAWIDGLMFGVEFLLEPTT